MEKLASVGIRREGKLHGQGFRSHYELRRSLGDPDPLVSKMSDEDGFITSEGRFVDREEGREVALACGQVSFASRRLLSSDVNWEPAPPLKSRVRRLGRR